MAGHIHQAADRTPYERNPQLIELSRKAPANIRNKMNKIVRFLLGLASSNLQSATEPILIGKIHNWLCGRVFDREPQAMRTVVPSPILHVNKTKIKLVAGHPIATISFYVFCIKIRGNYGDIMILRDCLYPPPADAKFRSAVGITCVSDGEHMQTPHLL